MKTSRLVPFAALLLVLTGCAVPAAESPDPTTSASQTAEPADAVVVEPLDLSGAWTQANSNSADSYQVATIADGNITIDWVNTAESTKALYWIGTYAAPTEASDSYSWESQGDIAQMKTALMASGDSTKTFTFEGGVLKYELTALGVTMTVEMKRD